jgi:hypothetical protein
MSLYDPCYTRSIRVLDLLLKINISFFFTLLQYSFNDNTTYAQVQLERDYRNIGKSADDFAPKLIEVKLFLIKIDFRWSILFGNSCNLFSYYYNDLQFIHVQEFID